MPGIVATEFAASAIGGAPPFRGPAPTAIQSAEEVAAAIAGLMERPVAELYTNPSHRDIARSYYEDVARFESHQLAPRRQ
jgi:hypothetical protein